MSSFFIGITGKNDIILSDLAHEQPEDGVVSSYDDDSDDSLISEPFVPTHEWQVVKKNQPIPAGLHVRMNFQTGIREAKLMDADEQASGVKKPEAETKESNKDDSGTKKETKNHSGPKIILADEAFKSGEDFMNEKLVFTKSHLKHALHDFKDKIGTEDIEHIVWSDDAKDALRDTLQEEEQVGE